MQFHVAQIYKQNSTTAIALPACGMLVALIFISTLLFGFSVPF